VSQLPVSRRHAYALVHRPAAGERCVQMLLEDYGRKLVPLLARDGATERLCATCFDDASCITAPPSAEPGRRLLAAPAAGTDAR
jgi:hypothetical protein